MPYRTEFVSAEVFMEHGGVTVYHVYKNNDIEDGPRHYWFCTHDDGDDDTDDQSTFDVRTRCDLIEDSPDGIKAAIAKAIDDGVITAAVDQ